MGDLEAIAQVVIYPAIGIARVGNSPSAYFFGPEVPGSHPDDPDNFRDAEGRIKRQAARFRIFGVDAGGNIIRELTANDADITWTVHVANKKAAWYRFDQAFDIPASKGELIPGPALASTRRNPKVKGADRQQLVIDPGARSITGRETNKNGGDPHYAFDTGTFFSNRVYLGELRTDNAGNLIFLGGFGYSASKEKNGEVTDFANNTGWHDDVSDGPVDAHVRLKDGRKLRAVGAWVICAPPNYAPGVQAFVTGYDLVFEVAATLNPSLKPKRIRFYEHIYPILARYSLNQWVNAGIARTYGWGSPSDFTDARLRMRLSDPSDASRPLRQAVFQLFRNPDYQVMEATNLPPIYGDAVTLKIDTIDPREWMAILPLQYGWLQHWAAGDFEQDTSPHWKTWEEMTPSERAHGLDRAALDETIGGPFHPGAEFTWPLRVPLLYHAPFRIKRGTGEDRDWGEEITSSIALAVGGPLDGSNAGDLTRWMAVPWQTDTSSCLSAYKAFSGEYLPTFWPARVPNDVLAQEEYTILLDPSLPTAEKEKAFALRERKKWLRGIVYNDKNFPPDMIRSPKPIAVFVQEWDRVGIVVRRPGPQQPSPFPAEMWVEEGRSLPPREQSAERVPQWMLGRRTLL